MNLKIRKKDIPVVRQQGMVVSQWKSIQTIVSRGVGLEGGGLEGRGGLLGGGGGSGGSKSNELCIRVTSHKRHDVSNPRQLDRSTACH